MSRKHFALLLLASATLSGVAQAQCENQPCGNGNDKWQSCTNDYYRNKLWPTPFQSTDTASVLAYFDQQRNNGWRLANTLGSAMFDPQTNALTLAGKNHLEWIVTQAPQSRRVVFVLQGQNQQATAQRVEAAQLAISEMVPVGQLPQIYLTGQESPGSSGVYQTAIHRAMVTSVPAPRLTSAAAAGSAAPAP